MGWGGQDSKPALQLGGVEGQLRDQVLTGSSGHILRASSDESDFGRRSRVRTRGHRLSHRSGRRAGDDVGEALTIWRVGLKVLGHSRDRIGAARGYEASDQQPQRRRSRSGDQQLVRVKCGSYRLRLVVPEIVIREVTNSQGEREQATINKVNSEQRKLRRLQNHFSIDPPVANNPAPVRDAYAEQLRQRLEEARVHTPALPDLPHDRVVDRALARRRPFDSEGHKGYRDTLICRGYARAGARGPREAPAATRHRLSRTGRAGT